MKTQLEKVYLAAAYERADEMRGVRDVLEVIGYQVTSSWIDQVFQPSTGAISADHLRTSPEQYAQYAEKDLADLRAADTMVQFTGGGRGGRHVEFGAAIVLGKRLIVVGPREHVFHALPAVEWCPDWSRLVMLLPARARA